MKVDDVLTTIELTLGKVQSGEIKPEMGQAIAELSQAWVASRKYKFISGRDEDTFEKGGVKSGGKRQT